MQVAVGQAVRGDEGLGVLDEPRRIAHREHRDVVVGELLFGFRNGSRYEANREELEDFLASPYVALLPVTLVTADRFGRIAASLRRKGRPLPTNDIWIAAHAMESGADLVSFDRHFDQVDGIAWIEPDA